MCRLVEADSEPPRDDASAVTYQVLKTSACLGSLASSATSNTVKFTMSYLFISFVVFEGFEVEPFAREGFVESDLFEVA